MTDTPNYLDGAPDYDAWAGTSQAAATIYDLEHRHNRHTYGIMTEFMHEVNEAVHTLVEQGMDVDMALTAYDDQAIAERVRDRVLAELEAEGLDPWEDDE